MTDPPLPSGYDETRRVHAGRSDCHVTIGFDRQQSHVPRFLVQLHYQASTAPVRWTSIARMDHNETSTQGHHVYREGLHVDVSRRVGAEVHLQVRHPPLPQNRGTVIRGCAEYLRSEADYFIDVYEGRVSPGGPPRWSPDGGEPSDTFIRANLLPEGMSEGSPVEDALTLEELSEVLAEATGTTPEEIEQGAEELDLAPPDEAVVVDE